MKARIKGTDIIVECKGIDMMLGENGKGVRCRYLNGENKGAGEVIPGDCLVEMEPDWEERHFNLVSNFVVASLARCGMSADEGVRRNIIDAAIEMADDIERRLKDRNKVE